MANDGEELIKLTARRESPRNFRARHRFAQSYAQLLWIFHRRGDIGEDFV
jgi:hypothetical protein